MSAFGEVVGIRRTDSSSLLGERTRRIVNRFAFSFLSHLILIVVTFLVAFPFLWMLSTALKPLPDVFLVPPTLIPAQPQWQNFAEAWNASIFSRFYVNSTVVTITITLAQLVNVSLAAYAFSRIEFPGRDVIFLLFLVTMMIPEQVTIVPVFIILTRLDWIDTYAALIVPFLSSAFGTFLLRQTFLTIPTELTDAAKLDGAGHLRTLWSVMLPLSAPILSAFSLLTFMWHWNAYFFPLIVTTSLEMRTLPIGLTLFKEAEGTTSWNLLMAAAIFVMAPVMILFLLAQRQFMQGIARTGLNG